MGVGRTGLEELLELSGESYYSISKATVLSVSYVRDIVLGKKGYSGLLSIGLIVGACGRKLELLARGSGSDIELYRDIFRESG